MLDHVSFAVSDFARSKAFYGKALEPLGIACVMEVTPDMTGDGSRHAGFGEAGKPYFWIGTGKPAASGVHVVFVTENRALVDVFYKAALAAGGRDNGPPGLRLHYHPDYYGGFVLDPDGNNIKAVCHRPESA